MTVNADTLNTLTDTQFVRADQQTVLVQQITFNPIAQNQPPFVVGTQGFGNRVPGLNADLLDGIDSAAFELRVNRAVANGYCELDSSGLVPVGRLPFGTPALTLGTSNIPGSTGSVIRSDATIIAFDATAPTTSAVADAAAVGSIAFAARRDHVHGREAFATPAILLGTTAVNGAPATTTLISSGSTIAAFDSTVPTTSAVADAAATGSIAFAARRDHLHGREAFATPVNIGTANAAGNLTTIPRSDHVHNHPGLTTGDLHTNFAILAGRAAGQTLQGGTATSDSLTLNPNNQAIASANTGRLTFDERINLFPSFPTSPGTDMFLARFNPTVTLAATTIFYAMDIAPTFTYGVGLTYVALRATGTFNRSTGSGFQTFVLFQGTLTETTSANVSPWFQTIFSNQNTSKYTSTGVAAGMAGSYMRSFLSSPVMQTDNATGAITWDNVVSVIDTPAFKSTTAGGALTVTNAIGLQVADPTYTATGTVTVTNRIGLDFPTHSVTSGNRTVSNVYVVKSALTATSGGTTKWFLYDSGGADSSLTGNLRLGDNTTPTALLDIVGKATISSAGLVTRYNNIATVSNGVPSEYATVDTTGLTANVASTVLYAVPAAAGGMYRVSSLVVETTAASVSSTLPNVQLIYTDNQTGGLITIDATPVLGVAGIGQTGALTANTVGTTSTGVIVVNAKASTNISYQTVNYASSLAGMAYALHIKCEVL